MQQQLKFLGIAGFFLCLCAPLALHFLGAVTGKNGNAQENRSLAQIPKPDLLFKDPSKYTSGLSAYFEDHFGGRAQLIKARKRMEIGINRQTTRVIKGSEHPWLYLTSFETKAQFSGAPYLTPLQISNWNDRYAEMKAIYAKHGIKFLSAKIPVKARIYPEYTENAFGTYNAALPDQRLEFDLDLEPALNTAKANGPVFFKTDTHWTRYGAYMAYLDIMETIQPGHNQQTDFKLDYFDMKTFSGDLVPLAGMDKVDYNEALKDIRYPKFDDVERKNLVKDDPRFKTFISKRTNTPGKTLVIIGDSFAHPIAPFFLSDFSKVIRVHHEIGAFDIESPLQYNPDVVLFMPAGRYSFKSLQGFDK